MGGNTKICRSYAASDSDLDIACNIAFAALFIASSPPGVSWSLAYPYNLLVYLLGQLQEYTSSRAKSNITSMGVSSGSLIFAACRNMIFSACSTVRARLVGKQKLDLR